jgi:carbamoyl-phosphate synthase large subunit
VQGESGEQEWPIPTEKLRRKLAVPSQGRLYYVRYAMKMGWSLDEINELTHYDKWFLAQMKELVDFEDELVKARDEETPSGDYFELMRRAKQWGYSDTQLASIFGMNVLEFRKFRKGMGVTPVYKIVDTCAAEFEASTPYYYSAYEQPFHWPGVEPTPDVITRGVQALLEGASFFAKHAEVSKKDAAVKVQGLVESARVELATIATACEDEIRLTDKPKVIIIGGGPNRIGQGIEFDYCCVQAAFAMREIGYESVMVNSNPETVSTDYDTSDLLFFEPLTHEDILNICERLNGGPFGAKESRNLVHGVIVQFGGQTPLNLARGLQESGVPILGTTVDSIDAAGDREQFRTLLQQLKIRQPRNGIAHNVAEARKIAREIGYPVLVRPSFVLGGRAMEIVSDEEQLNYYMAHAVEAAGDSPILVDKFLDAATECDVDCVADFDPTGKSDAGEAIVIGVMEHIEEAGIHSGDSACALPPYSLSKEIVDRLKVQTRALAKALRVRGLMNVQYAIRDGEIYVIEVNPRASRTVPFVSKATGVPWAKIAAKVMAGKSLAELGATEQPDPAHVSVKESVFPFSKFPGVDVILGPEMRSTGEVMGIDMNFPLAFAKSQIAAGTLLPTSGMVFISVRDADKEAVVPIARMLADSGFSIVATTGTARALQRGGVTCKWISKLGEGRPNIKDFIKNGEVQLIINTPTRKGPQTDEGKIRAMSVLNKVPIVTTLTGANAAARAIAAMQKQDWGVRPLQEYFGGGNPKSEVRIPESNPKD